MGNAVTTRLDRNPSSDLWTLFSMLNFKKREMGFVETARDMLLSGRDGAEVMEYLRREFVKPELAKSAERSLSSLHSVMTKVRNTVAESGQPTPDSMKTFKLSRKDVVTMKKAQEAARLTKSDRVLVIPDFPNLLKTVEGLLATASPTDTNARLLISLLIVSGRRLSEVCSPRSTFSATDHPYACRFSGQLKQKKGSMANGQTVASPPYVIPLLVPYSLFAKGLAAFRTKQFSESTDRRRAKTAVDTLTNAQLKTRYQWPLQVALEANRVISLPPCHIHDFRALYASAIWELYASDSAFNRVLMKVLGHVSLSDSLSYIHVRLDGCEAMRRTFGPLPDPSPIHA